MDWEKVKKAALLCTIGAFFVGIAGVVVALVWFGYTVWIQPRVSAPGQPSPIRWELPPMKAWLPALIIGIGLVLAAIFNLIAAFMSRRKLKTQVAELTKTSAALETERDGYKTQLESAGQATQRMQTDLSKVQRLLSRATEENDSAKDALKLKEQEVAKLTRDLALAQAGHKLELTTVNIKLRMTEEDLATAQSTTVEANKRVAELTKSNETLANELALATPSKRLREMEDNDAGAIQGAVVLSAIQFRNETANGFRYVDFVFSIFNQSVYPISIDSLGPGNIVFNRDEFVKEKKLEDNKARNVEPRRDGNFTIRQFLDLGDMTSINEASDDRVFRFDNLTVNIKGGAGFEDVVKLSQLKIDCYSLSKQYPLWRNYNIGPFHSRFNGEIMGRVREVYFQTDWLESYQPGKDYSYDFDFLLHVFIINHGAPKSIERFKFALKVNDELHEGEKQSLAGFRVNRRDREPQTIKDIEDDNDENLFEKRGGWLRFRVRGIKRYEEDRPPLEIALDAIDSNSEPNRLTPLAQSEWLGHAHFQESHVLGPGQWAESEMKAHPEP